MFSLLRSNNKQQAGAGHFATCKVQYFDDSSAVAAGSPAREVEALEPPRLSVMKPRDGPRKYGGRTTTAPAASTASRSSAPLPGSKLLKAWRAARK